MNLVHATYEPSGKGPHPTILALHGWGANGLDLLGIAPYICGGRFRVVCPQGPVETPIGPGVTGFGWFPFSGGGPPDVPAMLEGRQCLRAFLHEYQSEHSVDPHSLVLLGFSQGGVMAYSLGLPEPDRFAGLCVLSSWLVQPLLDELGVQVGSAASLPALVQHGSRDDLIDVDRARESIEILRNLRVPVKYQEYDMGHEISARSLADLSAWLNEKIPLSPTE